MEESKNMTQEQKEEKTVEAPKKKGMIDKGLECWKQFGHEHPVAKDLICGLLGAGITLGIVGVLGGSDDSSDTPAEVVPDVIDVACEVKDVIPDVAEAVKDAGIEVGEF